MWDVVAIDYYPFYVLEKQIDRSCHLLLEKMFLYSYRSPYGIVYQIWGKTHYPIDVKIVVHVPNFF